MPPEHDRSGRLCGWSLDAKKMTFAKDIAEKALVECQRSCCICHKFCGTKIELHHITPKSKGGEDTLENCIPLCFDCHSDVGHYNDSHPKGRKYSPTELKSHRDHWYNKLNSSVSLHLMENSGPVDKELVLAIIRDLAGTGLIPFMRQHDYHDPFHRKQHLPMAAFEQRCKTPEYEFIDSDMEMHKAALRVACLTFRDQVGQHTDCLDDDGRPEYVGVLRAYKSQNRDAFYAKAKVMNQAADLVLSTYDSLVRTAKARFGITIKEIEGASNMCLQYSPEDGAY